MILKIYGGILIGIRYIYGDNENRKIAAGDYGPLKQVACHIISQDLSFPDILNGNFPETALRYETQKVFV